MLKRMLVLLGETPSSVAARAYAFRLAREKDVDLAGLAGIDLAAIEAPRPGALGATSFMARLEQQLKRQAGDIRTRLHETYEQECKAHDVEFDWLSFEGDPLAALYLATEVRDLVLTGHDTGFEGNIHDGLPEALAKLLLTTPRPVIVCGDEPAPGDEFLISYDGSVPAMRALQMFALLNLGAGKRIQVTSIDAQQELAVRRAAGASGFLRSHGYEAESVPITTRVKPAEVLAIEVVDRKIGTLVMGAYGHHGLRAALFGSSTQALVSNPPCALFLYH